MIEWKQRLPEGKMERGKEYLLTDGERIMTGHYNTPYDDKTKYVWYSNGSKSYIDWFEFTHYAEINLPERRGGLVNPDGGNYPLKWMSDQNR